jgi:hypothetical protein
MKQKHLTLLCITFSTNFLVSGNAYATPNLAQAQFKEAIFDGILCVPNLSHGYRSIELNNGSYEDADEKIDIENIAFGKLDETDVAVAFITNWTGGSGIFDSLILYKLVDGKATTIGTCAIGDRVQLLSLKITNNKVKLEARQTLAANAKPYTAWITKDQFDKAECLQFALTGQLKQDVEFMSSLYDKAFWHQAFTVEDKKKAIEICNRHKTDRKEFTNYVRLKIEEGGYGPGPNPLQYDQNGTPAIYVDSTKVFPLAIN